MSAAGEKLITIFGGSGFLGRHVVQALAKQGYRIRVGVRRPDLAGHLQPLGGVGQIMPVQANLRYPASIAAACVGADIVINLVGVLYNAGPQNFDALHAFGAQAVAREAKAAGVDQLIHVSAIGADDESTSEYARSKAQGEAGAQAEFADVVVMRPSVLFGPEDDFFNRFATMARFSPALPLMGGGKTLLQPVFVGDVARAITQLVTTGQGAGKTYELGGPEVFSFTDLMKFTLRVSNRKRLLVPVPWPVAQILSTVLEILPKPLLTRDQLALLKSDNVVSEEAQMAGLTLAGLGIDGETIETIVPTYLYRFRKAGQFSAPTSA